MQTLYYCLFIALLLPFVTAAASLPYRKRQFGQADLKEPRTQAAQLEGAGARVVAAQGNAWEALAVFTVAVFLAYANGVTGGNIEIAGMVFIAARIAHPVFYVADIGPGRSLAFVAAIGACLYIIRAALF